MHNLIVLMDPSEDDWQMPMQVGKMITHRFCVAEDDELSKILEENHLWGKFCIRS